MSAIVRFLTDFVHELTDPAVTLDTKGQPVAYNDAYVRLTGLRRRELVRRLAAGQDAFDLVSAHGGVDRAGMEPCLAEGRAVRLAEVAATTAAGAEITIWFTLVPIDDENGNRVGLLQVIRDVSAEASVQDRLKEALALAEARVEDQERLVAKRTQELTIALEEVTRLSRIDPLTNLMNRRAFSEIAEREIAVAARHERRLALVMCDLDYFKSVNDTHGHRTGDRVLQASSDALRSALRTTDHLGRFGGEEFLAMVVDADVTTSLAVAERCRTAVEAVQQTEGLTSLARPQTASFGIATFPENGATFDDLVLRADKALYRAKQQGRNRCIVYDPTMPAVRAVRGDVDRPKLMLLDADRQRSAESTRLLESTFDVVAVQSTGQAMALFEHEVFDAIIADEGEDMKGAVSLLLDALRLQPRALRILLVENVLPFLQGVSVAHLDYLLLRSEVSHLKAAIADGRRQRDVLRSTLLAGSGPADRQVGIWSSDQVAKLVAKTDFDIAYQPIVTCSDRTRVGYEALCRPRAPDTDVPGLFAAAVRGSQIWELGRAVRAQGIQSFDWMAPEELLFMNVHPAELTDPRFLNEEPACEVGASRIILEVTERTSIGNAQRLREVLRRLRKRGYRFAVDDLGAGYASLNSIAVLRPQFIKIDMEIVRDLGQSETKSRLVKRIVDYANDDGVTAIAEGVETEAEAEAIERLGCHMMQGYLCGKPKIVTNGRPTSDEDSPDIHALRNGNS